MQWFAKVDRMMGVGNYYQHVLSGEIKFFFLKSCGGGSCSVDTGGTFGCSARLVLSFM